MRPAAASEKLTSVAMSDVLWGALGLSGI